MNDIHAETEFEKIQKLIEQNKRFLILGHVDPDGDCMGSMLALALFLVGRGKKVVCFAPGEIANVYNRLPGIDLFVDQSEIGRFEHDIIFALDSPTTARTADLVRSQDKTTVVNIDHHPTNERYGSINVVVAESCATTILIYRFLAACAPGEITEEIASCLYLGILMDTGGFRFKNTNAEALETAGRLAKHGARPYELAHDFIYMKKYSTLKLLSLALDSIEVHGSGKAAVMNVTQSMIETSGGAIGDTEGFVDYASSIDEVELSALFREIGPEETRVSLRSRDHHDVAKLAERYGGGGHRNAAGLTFRGGIEAAKSAIIQGLETLLGEHKTTEASLD